MPENLFPTEDPDLQEPSESLLLDQQAAEEPAQWGRSWRFDFERGEFVLTPTGKVAEADEFEAWVEWCRKTLYTPRYEYLVYSSDYGHELNDLIGRGYTREAIESEIQRIVTETLMVDPRTDRVENFRFEWSGDEVRFTCEIVSTRGESAEIGRTVVIGLGGAGYSAA